MKLFRLVILGGCACSAFALHACSSAFSIPPQPAVSGSRSQSQQTFAMQPAVLSVSPVFALSLSLSDDDALAIGRRIWQNECAGTVDGLTSWNKNEDFASLGIGHSLWFPSGYVGAFAESFPRLIDFVRANGGLASIPEWLSARWNAGERTCPWETRAEFLRAKNSPEMRELRTFLASTVALQARFIANRMESSLVAILAVTPPEDTNRIKTQFYRVAAAPSGLYVLADYVNFKGEGIKDHELYSKRGWGLRHVLQSMNGTESGKAALVEFSTAAKRCLAERVKFSPPERNEAEWLEGWLRRVKSYVP
jgi:hypothetical protein